MQLSKPYPEGAQHPPQKKKQELHRLAAQHLQLVKYRRHAATWQVAMMPKTRIPEQPVEPLLQCLHRDPTKLHPLKGNDCDSEHGGYQLLEHHFDALERKGPVKAALNDLLTELCEPLGRHSALTEQLGDFG